MSDKIKQYGGMVAAIATCEDCGWRLERKNAIGCAAIHARKYLHNVTVEIINVVSFKRIGEKINEK